MRFHHHQKAQAIVELGVFGSIILLIFGILLSYMQRLNDQQYTQMETFRTALQIACLGGFTPETGNDYGASAQLTLLQNRRHVDISNNFRKGSPTSISASSSVFWAVPQVGDEPASRVYVKVNEDFSPDLFSKDEDAGVEDINTESETIFDENLVKQETPGTITNTRSSSLQDTVTTALLAKNGTTIWNVTQGAYYADGQYRYGSAHVGTKINQGRTWETEF